MQLPAINYHRILFSDYGGAAYVLCMYLVLGIFEMYFPVEPDQGLSARFKNVVATGLFLGVGGLLTAWLSRTGVLHDILHSITIRRKHLSERGIVYSVAILIIYGIVSDVLFYWYHRAQHKISLLWPLHELHHTESQLNATTSLRSYWLEAPMQAVLIALPASCAVAMDGRAVLILPALFTGWLFFTHANWRLSLGSLTPFVCGPQLHRIHHSNVPAHQNKNFAQFFPCIDMIFGTYYRPGRDEFPSTGLERRTLPATWSEITIGPFQDWAKRINSYFDGYFDQHPTPVRRPTPTLATERRQRQSKQRRRAR